MGPDLLRGFGSRGGRGFGGGAVVGHVAGGGEGVEFLLLVGGEKGPDLGFAVFNLLFESLAVGLLFLLDIGDLGEDNGLNLGFLVVGEGQLPGEMIEDFIGHHGGIGRILVHALAIHAHPHAAHALMTVESTAIVAVAAETVVIEAAVVTVHHAEAVAAVPEALLVTPTAAVPVPAVFMMMPTASFHSHTHAATAEAVTFGAAAAGSAGSTVLGHLFHFHMVMVHDGSDEEEEQEETAETEAKVGEAPQPDVGGVVEEDNSVGESWVGGSGIGDFVHKRGEVGRGDWPLMEETRDEVERLRFFRF
jgi:hypothetical protein